MRKLFTIILLTALLLPQTGCSPDDSIHQAADESVQRFEAAGVQNMENDALFVAEVASANMLQVQLAKAASANAVSPEVRKLAEQMLNEHQQILEELDTLAAHGNFVLPASLGASHQKTYEDISQRTGLPFDLAYIKEAVDGHKNLLKRYEDMAKNGVSMEVKQFASRQLPLAKQHFETAEAMERRVNNI